MAPSRPDKLLFPAASITKADLAAYFERVSQYILPHVKGRPLTLHRFPDGIGESGFFQKDVPEHFPDWIKRRRVKRKSGGHITHMLAENPDALTYIADQAGIALHSWLAQANRPDCPDRMIFDLDPPGQDFAPVVSAARALRAVLDEFKLTSFVMTTGSSGLHVTVPLQPNEDFERVRAFAGQLAQRVADDDPQRFTVAQRKNKRQGRVYLDIQRNAYAQTGIAPYSPRALPGAPVATPLDWKELGKSGLRPRSYTIKNIFRRLSQRHCPWAELTEKAAALPDS